MSPTAQAEEHLRVIRSLMEKATVYRAISAPSALVGGLLAIGLAALLIYLKPETSPFSSFALPWLGVLLLTAAANLVFLRRDAHRRGDPFFSAGMRLAMRALLPGFLTAGVFTLFLMQVAECEVLLAMVWMLCYGLALLATSDFAPRSIALLGWAFLLCGLSLVGALFRWEFFHQQPAYSANLIMEATFGLFHLIYAAFTWPRKTAAVE